MFYLVEYRNQNWGAASIEAATPFEAAKLYLASDAERRFEDYGHIDVSSGAWTKQRESFVIDDVLRSTGVKRPDPVASNSPVEPRAKAVTNPAPSLPFTRPKTKLQLAFQISVVLVALSMLFLLVAFQAPELVLGKSPIASQGTQEGSVAGFYQSLSLHNYRTNVEVLHEVAQNTVVVIGVVCLALMWRVKRDEKAKELPEKTSHADVQPTSPVHDAPGRIDHRAATSSGFYCKHCCRPVIPMGNNTCPSCLQPLSAD